jgi:hypothetical protein
MMTEPSSSCRACGLLPHNKARARSTALSCMFTQTLNDTAGIQSLRIEYTLGLVCGLGLAKGSKPRSFCCSICLNRDGVAISR